MSDYLKIFLKFADEIIDGIDEPNGAGIFLLDEQGRVFLGRRAETSSEPGMWCTPGGGVEEGEDAATAAAREAEEEFGIIVSPEELYNPKTFIKDDGFKFTTFIVDGSSDIPIDMREREHDDYGWFSLDELPTPLHPGLEAYLKEI